MNDIIFALIAAFLAMDAVVFGQFGFSRPIVCGPVAGYLTGDPFMGLRVGAILELVWINTIPIGTTLVPDVAVAAMLSVFWTACAASSSCGPNHATVAVIAMCVALPASMIFRKLDLRQRISAARLNEELEAAVGRGDFGAPGRAVFLSALKHFARNAFLFWAALQLSPLFCKLSRTFPSRLESGFEIAYMLLPAVGIGVFFYNFYDSVLKVVKK